MEPKLTQIQEQKPVFKSIIEYARARRTQKRGGNFEITSISTELTDHSIPDAMASQSPALRGKGRPSSMWKITSMPTKAQIIEIQRGRVIASPRKMRARSVLHSGVR